MKTILITLFTLLVSTVVAQIYEPEGLNMPGVWNGWTNPPTNSLALANPNQVADGRLMRIGQGQARWQTIFYVAPSGGDFSAGTYEFVYTSGPGGSPWSNTWKGAAFNMNTLMNLTFNSGANNSITLSNHRWYTMNWVDVGYNDTQGIFMETSSEPVTFASATQSPTNGNVENTDAVIVTVTASATLSVEEKVYVRYSTDAFTTSSLAAVAFTGTTGTAIIPPQAAASTVQYYVFSTTVNSPNVADADKVTIHTLTNGSGNFNYTVNSPLPPVNITFQVDMNQVTLDPSGVFIAGSFNGFSNQPMNGVGAGIYEYTASLAQGSSIQYKFKNGTNGWEGNIGAPCGDGSNRTLTVGAVDASVDLVCFNACSLCPPTYDITFRVNMSDVTVSSGVYINGNFPPANWSTPQLMTSAGNGVYTYTATLGAGNTYEYKFMNNSAYEGNLSQPCGNGTNRILTVPSANTTLPVDCFNYCGLCAPFYDMVFAVNMSNTSVSANGVHLAGNFGAYGYANWSPSEIPMSDADGNGVYTVSLTLPAGRSFEYKFINGNDWLSAETVPVECNTSGNRTFTVMDYDGMVGGAQICFGGCGACTMGIVNDSPYSAVAIQYNTNMNYPTCYSLIGNCALASDSPQSTAFSGKDVWYRFVAQSSAVSIAMNSVSQDDVISVYHKSGDSFTLVAGGAENAVTGNADAERLNLAGLTIGQTYYVSVGSVNSTGDVFQLCVQHLMPSYCSMVVPAGGLNLCDLVRSVYRGSALQGVSYTYTFAPTGSTLGSPTAVTGTNGLLSLSNPIAALRYGGTYTSSVNVRYNLFNGAGNAEPIDVAGTAIGGCGNLTIRTQPNLEVRSSQRCNASLLRSNWLMGNPAAGEPRICGATSYGYEFTQVASCEDPTVVSVAPVIYTTTSPYPYLPLGVLTSLPNTGTWKVRIRPNFAHGNGEFGPPQMIQVIGTASMELEDEAVMSEKSAVDALNVGVYPNPSNGSLVELNLQDLAPGAVQVRVLDAAGRVVHAGSFSTDGNLRTTLNFTSQLNPGVYMIDILNNGIARTERLVVQQ